MRPRLRKVTRNRGQFPSEQAALKVLYLAVRNLQDYRSPEYRDPQLGMETSPPGVHDLLRRTNPDPMTATITYTDGRSVSGLVVSPVAVMITSRDTQWRGGWWWSSDGPDLDRGAGCLGGAGCGR